MTQENLIQIGLVLEEVVNNLKLISVDEDLKLVTPHRHDLISDLASAIHYARETTWKYLEALDKLKPAIGEEKKRNKAKTISQFMHYCASQKKETFESPLVIDDLKLIGNKNAEEIIVRLTDVATDSTWELILNSRNAAQINHAMHYLQMTIWKLREIEYTDQESKEQDPTFRDKNAV